MVKFSERDALLHVIEWQIPTALMFAVTLVFWCAWAIPFRDIHARVVISVIGAVLLFWACTAVIFIFLDMLLLPPLFALIRFSHSLSRD